MIIVGGTFEFEAEQRDAFLTSRLDMMRVSRGEHGCLEYTFSADPIEPTRVLLFERWESQDALDAHLATQRSAARAPSTDAVPTKATITLYDVAGERSLGR